MSNNEKGPNVTVNEGYKDAMRDLKISIVELLFNEPLAKLRVSKLTEQSCYIDSKKLINDIEKVTKPLKIKLKNINVDYLGYTNAKKALRHIDSSKIDETVSLIETIRDSIISQIK